MSSVNAMSSSGWRIRSRNGSDGASSATLAAVIGRARSCEANPRVEKGVADVRDDLRQYGHEDRDQRRSLDDVDVAVEGGIEQQLAKASILKEHLDDHDARQEPVQLQDNDREWGDQRVAKGVAQNHPPIGQTL